MSHNRRVRNIWSVAVLLLISLAACTDDLASTTPDRSTNQIATSTTDGLDPVPDQIEAVDEHWTPDLDSDGDADAVLRTENQLQFLVREGNSYVQVTDQDGEELTIDLDDNTTMTCAPDGLLLQSFEPPADQTSTGALRLARLDINGSTGEFTPSPSFFFGPEFELPKLGQGCARTQ
jgi:hypothetical protein